MNRISRLAILFTAFLFSFAIVFSQDSASLDYKWKASAQKKGERKYEITFTAADAGEWQLYAPNQVLNEVKVAGVVFPDSSIVQEGPFVESGVSTTIKTEIFDNVPLKVYEEQSDWKA